MRSSQIIKELEEGRLAGKEVIEWWRKENDFSDYELLDNFLAGAEKNYEIENFKLLDANEMWDVLNRLKTKGLRRHQSDKSDTIEWRHRGKDGQQRVDELPFSAASIMSIFEAETHGDTIC